MAHVFGSIFPAPFLLCYSSSITISNSDDALTKHHTEML